MENPKYKVMLRYIILSNPLAKYFYVYVIQCEQQHVISHKRCEIAREGYVMAKKTEISCTVVQQYLTVKKMYFLVFAYSTAEVF